MNSTDPFKEIGTNSWDLLRQIYEGLVALDNSYRPIPQLAKSWQVSPDNLTYTFTLRDGVKFHNGKAMTSADVKYSLEYYKASATRKSQLAQVTSIAAPDPKTVTIMLAKPLANFLAILGNPVIISIVPQGSADNQGLVNTPIGTGPFKVDSFTDGTHAVLTKFADYTSADGNSTDFGGKKQAQVDRLELTSVPVEQTILAALQTKQYDIAIDVNAEDVGQIDKMSGMKSANTAGTNADAMYINTRAAVISDMKLRAAILTAIDTNKLLATTAANQGKVTYSYTSPVLSWYDKDAAVYWPWTGGADQAKQLLSQSSYHGETIEIIAGTTPDQQTNAVLVGQMLTAIGINNTIQKLDQATYQNRLNSGSFQLASTGTPLRTVPDILYADWYSNHGKSIARFGFHDEQFDTIFENAQVTADEGQRNSMFAQLEKILKDNAAISPWYFNNTIAAVADRVQGYTNLSSDYFNGWNVSLKG